MSMKPDLAQSKQSRQPGYIALVSVLVVGAVGTVIATSLLVLGLGSGRNSLAEQQSLQARALADACAEDALQEIRDLTSYTGTVNLTLGVGSCSATVTNTGGLTREIESMGTAGDVVRRVNIFIDAINPQINTTSWQEVADF